MATTSRPITELVLGIRDTSGAVVPSAKCRFYQPGTLVQQTVFSDAACTSGLSQPVTCNAYGQATVYTREAVRLIAKNSAETTTHYDNVVNLNRADAVYMTVAGVNGGAETTVEEAFEDAVTSLGAGFMYSDNSGSASATDRNYVDRIRELCVSVKDYGAVGDGSTDDTAAITATITAANNRPIYFPVGTYLISSAINLTPAGNTRVRIFGAASGTTGASIVKNASTTGNAFRIHDGFGGEYVFEDLEISASTASTGTAIICTQAARLSVDRLTISGHRYGIDSIANITAIRATQVTIADTAGICFDVVASTAATLDACRAVGPGTGGTSRGYELGYATANGCLGFSLNSSFYLSTSSVALGCHATSSSVGYNVAGPNVSLIGCRGALNTTDVTASSQTNLTLIGNSVSTYSISSTTVLPTPLANVSTTTEAGAAPTWTMNFANGAMIHRFIGTYTAAAQNVTIAVPTNTSSLVPGTVIWIVLCKQGANNLNLSWPATFLDEDGSSLGGPASVTTSQAFALSFVWNGTSFTRLMYGLNAVI